jgi:hypothetical protein
MTLSRIGELFLDVFYMLYLAEAYRREEPLRRFAAQTYYWVGIAGVVYSILSLFAAPVGIKLGGVSDSLRLMGFNNEGGSYGTYLLTVIFIVAVLRSQGWMSRRAAVANYAVFGLAVAGSQSKAALAEAIVFCILIPALRLRGVKLAVTSASLCMVAAIVFVAADVPLRLAQYAALADKYETVSQLRPRDLNITAGRVSGLYIAPKMIAAHPLAGIGLGNYPIVRDDPTYRHGTPIVALGLDSPSLGPIDYIVDLGFPLFLYFTWVEIAPAFDLLRRRKSTSLVCLVLMQPVANWFGAHLNLIYPWVAAGIALGFAYASNERNRGHDEEQVAPDLLEALP